MANDTQAIFGYRRPEEAAELTPLLESLKADAETARRRIAAGETDRVTVGDELEEAYFIAQAKVRETAEAKIKTYEKRWRSARDPIKELTNLTRWQQKFGSMDEAALSIQIQSWIEQPKGADPDMVDTLLAQVTKSGHPDAGVLRQAMARNRYDQPWLEDCPELDAMVRLHSAPYGTARAVTPYGLDDWKIRDLLQETEE